MKIKLIDSKIFIVVIIFIISVIYMTNSAINSIDNSNVDFISKIQAEDVISQLEWDLHLLHDTVNILAEDTYIIDTLTQIKNEGYTSDAGKQIIHHIDNVQQVIMQLSFLNSVGVLSLDGEFLIHDNVFIDNYIAAERPWFDESMLDANEAVTTGIYTQINTNELVFSIVRFINDPNTNEPLGAVILAASLDNLIATLIENYRIADLDIFIEYVDSTVYTNNKIVSSELKGSTNFTEAAFYKDRNINFLTYSFYTDRTIDFLTYSTPYLNLTMAIDLDDLKENPHVVENHYTIVLKIILLTCILMLLIMACLTFFVKPVLAAVNSLINTIEELGDDFPEYTSDIRNIAELAHIIETNIPNKIKYLMYHDDLTGLPNRKMFKQLYRTFTANEKAALIMLLDIKNFKGINDSSGDNIGDLVLIDVGIKLKEIIDKEDGIVIRYSGDEFIVIVPYNCQDLESCYRTKILSVFQEPIIFPGSRPIHIRFNTAGIISPFHCYTEEDMITKLYVMLAQAKELNTPGLLLFNQETYSIYVKEESIRAHLKTAIETNEFVIYYQPIVDGNRVIHKAEALIRWFSKDLGFVPPNEFIFIAEQTRMILELGEWIIDRVAQDLQMLLKDGQNIQVSINISPIQIVEEDFVPRIKAIIDKYNIDYKYICFEITESTLIDAKQIAMANIKALQELGITLALDDFGTGYASFGYLNDYNLDIIKIDKIFVDDSTQYPIIDGIYRISEALNMQIVIEGVETKEQFDELKKFGLIQGYYFSRPVKYDEFIQLL
ncbi:MAG: hypothetical protein BEN19_08250 [Epulopiscium sp. Nuni2H_MBin003]|nr:MAG: hypothetical protein BEN19_08250 [Epulopiscium sp. Nuni2H_MBin003]